MKHDNTMKTTKVHQLDDTPTYQGKPLTDCYGQPPLRAISVKVPQAIINGSKPRNFKMCMVAQALQEAFPTATHIWVDTSVIKFTYNGLRYYFLPTQTVKDFIAAYDRGEPVKEFRFRTSFRARIVPSGFYQTHPKGDNRTNPSKKYDPTKKRRKYPSRARINGVCLTIEAD